MTNKAMVAPIILKNHVFFVIRERFIVNLCCVLKWRCGKIGRIFNITKKRRKKNAAYCRICFIYGVNLSHSLRGKIGINGDNRICVSNVQTNRYTILISSDLNGMNAVSPTCSGKRVIKHTDI